MGQINSMLNICVFAAMIVAATFWVGGAAAPLPLPNDAHFVSQVHQSGVVLVKFGANWCGPCRKIEAELDELTRTSSADVSVIKIDIDHNRDLAAHYQISSIPCLLLFKNGKQVGRALGYRSHEQLKSWIATTH